MSWHSRDSPLRRTSCSNKKRTIPGTNPSPSAILRIPSSDFGLVLPETREQKVTTGCFHCRDCTIDLATCQHLDTKSQPRMGERV
ncbi:hypothetical protein CEXT_447971 [Caerostris extrusa]|uniref:Uncharacterized protein n=1 Tax=Caerostris extrusa TaxID=172846 RepID=A0AAV4R0L1_CAEEX|nr:hypothetical protein CEXT_447971 [Caerostris extrusa]